MKKYYLILIISLLLFTHSQDLTALSYKLTQNDGFEQLQNSKSSLSSNVKLLSVNPGVEEKPLITNIIENPGFEDVDNYNGPAQYSYYASSHIIKNYSYTDLTSNGSYSALFEAKGTSQNSASNYYYKYLPSNPREYIRESLEFNFSYYLENPDIITGGNIYLRFAFYNGSTYYVYYQLSYGQNSQRFNYTTSKTILLNSSLSSWHDLNRNVTNDFEDAFGSISSNLYLNYLQFYTRSPRDASDNLRFIFDDVKLNNQTGYDHFSLNGDFESGSSSGWSGSYREDPSSVTLSTDHVDGNTAVELLSQAKTDNSNGYASIRKYWSDLQGYYVAPNSPIIEFDWKYNQTYNGGYGQNAYFIIYHSNETFWGYSRWYLGHDINYGTISNSTNYYSLYADNFGSKNTWNHQIIDLSELFRQANFTNTVISEIGFYIEIGNYKNSTVKLLVDNFQFNTYPLGDQGFEQDSYWDINNPVMGWHSTGSNYPYINRTSDSHQGDYAANITVFNNAWEGLYRSTYFTIKKAIFTDFWWRLDEIITGSNTYTYYELEFTDENEQYYYLYYILGSSSAWNPSNSSDSIYYYVEDYNTTGSWLNLRQNIQSDLDDAFGEKSWILRTLYHRAATDVSGKISIIFDDTNFVADTHGPIINSVQIIDTPNYYDPTKIRVNATDIYSSVDEVVIHYQNNSGWFSLLAEFVGNYYEVSIPAHLYNTLINFYVNATDSNGLISIDDNSGSYYSFVITDEIEPSIEIITPYNNSLIIDEIIITAETHDSGSGIAFLEIYDGVYLLSNISTLPFEYVWDTRLTTNGSHQLKAIAYDNAGNFKESELIFISIQNDINPPFLSFVQLNPQNPQPGDSVRVSIGAVDYSKITNITLYYKQGDQSWQISSMQSSGPLYYYDIPAVEWDTTVLYYIIAYDAYNQSSSIGSLENPLQYIVLDIIPPTLSVMGPESDISGIVTFVATGNDLGSGIDTIDVYFDNVLEVSSTTNPLIFSWDSNSVTNGYHQFNFIVTDNANNSASLFLNITVNNLEGLYDTLSNVESFYQNNGFILGIGSAFAVWTVLKLRKGGKSKK